MAKPAPLTKKLRELWADWNATILDCGGWPVSRPDVWPLQFEVRDDSALPKQLKQLGYTVKHVGVSERLLPTAANQNPAPQQVAVFEFGLPVT